MEANVYLEEYASKKDRWVIKKQDNPVPAEASSYFLFLGAASGWMPARIWIGLNWDQT